MPLTNSTFSSDIAHAVCRGGVPPSMQAAPQIFDLNCRGTTGTTFLLVGATGFEPATFRPPAECATRLRHAPKAIDGGSAEPAMSAHPTPKRATGIEPVPRAWKAHVQPLTPRPRCRRL